MDKSTRHPAAMQIWFLLTMIGNVNSGYINNQEFEAKRPFTTRSPRLYALTSDKQTADLATFPYSELYDNFRQTLSTSSLFSPTTYSPRPLQGIPIQQHLPFLPFNQSTIVSFRQQPQLSYEPTANPSPTVSLLHSKRNVHQFSKLNLPTSDGHKSMSHFQPIWNSATTYYPPNISPFYDGSAIHSHKINSQLKSYIKEVLKLESLNETLDQLISSSLNLETTDPTYVFVLPGRTRNKTLILHKSNFIHPDFPHISPIQRHIMHSNISKLYNLIENIEKIKPHQILRPPLMPSFRDKVPTSPVNPNVNHQLERPDTSTEDLDEAESNRVVEENVRTERNFLRYMRYLNDHPRDSFEESNFNDLTISNDENLFRPSVELLHSSPKRLLNNVASGWRPISYGPTSQFTPSSSHEEDVSSLGWKELGLDGWVGGIKHPSEKHFSKYSSVYRVPSTTEIGKPVTLFGLHKTSIDPFYQQTQTQYHHRPTVIDESNVPHEYHTPRYSFESAYDSKSPPFAPTESMSVTSNSPSDAWDVPGQHHNVPPELSELLSLEYYRTQYNSSNPPTRSQSPRWPVTSSRAEHADDDVFIGRANNPFGHSTKWSLNNASADTSETRKKRGALLLYSMVKCSTGCDPLVYKGYGCYCGFLGSGRTLDGIDRCCKTHDYCYERANCPMFLEYFVPYLWKCYRGRPLCAIDHGEWGGPGSCASRLCECDQALSKCLRRFYCPRKRAVCTSSPWRLLQNVIML